MPEKRAQGIFISEHQQTFKWLGNSDYLAYRVMDGLVPDAKYQEWIPEVIKSPRRIAVHNFRNHKTAIEQFDAFKNMYGREAHCIAGDYEDTYTAMSDRSAKQYEMLLDMFAEEYQVPIISYSNASTYANHLNPLTTILSRHGLWIVRFAPDGADINTAQPKLDYYGIVYATGWEFWQFGWKGFGPDYGAGSDNICLDVFNGTVQQLDDFLRISVPEPQPDDIVKRVDKLEFLYQELNTDLEELSLNFAAHRAADRIVEEKIWEQIANLKSKSHKHWWMK